MDALIDAFGSAFKALIQVLYQADESATIESLKEMSIDVNVRVLEKYEFIIVIAVTILIGVIAACIFGCFICCCSCCCCPVYQDEYYGNISSNSSSSLNKGQDVQYNYYG